MAELKSKYPLPAAAAYAVFMTRLVKEMHAIYMAEYRAAVERFAAQYQGDSSRADGPLDSILAALEKAKQKAAALFSPSKIRQGVSRWANNLNLFNRGNISDQFKAAKRVDPTEKESWLKDFMTASVEENVGYITTIPLSYHDQIVGVIMKGVKEGWSNKAMAEAIQNVYAVSDRRARFIARDQTGSINGQLTARRHQAGGVTRFFWRTSEDERVRAEHAAFADKEYTYADGAGSRHLLPGRDYNCRCTGDPIFD
jgi:SPP1 gp7 family putative phage head morphogenesis protein